jgi:NCS2 family nucleobase:cation symporter-2
VAAISLGLLAPADQAAIVAAPWLALPPVEHLGLAFNPSLILPFVIGAFAATTKAAALTGLARKPAGPAGQGDPAAQIAAGVRADGIGTVLAGLLGTIGMSPSPSGVALTASTGLASRHIAWAMLAICTGIALVPKLALSIVFLPKPVISGVLLFGGCLVLANGLQMLAEVKLDPRRGLVVGLGVFAAIAALTMPDLAGIVPASFAPVVASPLNLGGTVALLANLVLRIGSGRTLRLTVAEPGVSDAFAAAWRADPDLPEATRAAVAGLLADHVARADEPGPVEVEIRITEFAVRVRLRPIVPRRPEGFAWLGQMVTPPRGLLLAR